MKEYIAAKSEGLISGEEAMVNLVNCVKELRNGCQEQQQPEIWDEWLDKAKTELPGELYKRMLFQNVRYLKKDSRLLTLEVKTAMREEQPELEDLD